MRYRQTKITKYYSFKPKKLKNQRKISNLVIKLKKMSIK